MFSCVIALVRWIGIVDIFLKYLHRFKKRGGDRMAVRRVRRLFLLNLIPFHVLHDVCPRYPQFSWCGRYHHVLTYLHNIMLMYQQFNKLTDFGVNVWHLSLEWLEFVQTVWEKSNYFLWTLWQPCNHIHHNVRDEVTYPSSKFKCKNRVWESSLRIESEYRVRISSPNIESEYRVWISSPNIESKYRVRKSSPKMEYLKFGNE